jgi:predicted DNA-binding helix-hairpin-helix protein
MARTFMVSLLFGVALISAGCVEPRSHRHARWNDADREDRVDINSASHRQLSRLPGISDEDASRIIANRPYPTPEALVRRGVIGPRKFDEIEVYVYAGGGRREWRDDERDNRRWDDRDHERYYDDRYDR